MPRERQRGGEDHNNPKWARRKRKAVTQTLSWATVNPGLLREAVERVTDEGDAILFGKTRKGNAVKVQVFSDDELEPFYCETGTAAEEALAEICELWRPATIPPTPTETPETPF
jgi:hypothetical protein